MVVVWIGDKIKKEVRDFVLTELGISSTKIEGEVARKAIVFAVREKKDEFRKAWKEGRLDV